MKFADCIFCKIIKKEIPAKIIAESDLILVIVQQRGHIRLSLHANQGARGALAHARLGVAQGVADALAAGGPAGPGGGIGLGHVTTTSGGAFRPAGFSA